MVDELIIIVPSILWFLFAVVVFSLFYRPIRNELLPYLGSIKAAGIELSFVREAIESAIELAEKSPQWNVVVPNADKEKVLKRIKHHMKILQDVTILWVDDHPENNRNERKMFHQLAVQVDIARSTNDALDMLKHQTYDLILSDMARGDDSTAGIDLLQKLKEANNRTPVIFYVGVLDPTKGIPPLSFGITNRPDELLHLTLDALERGKDYVT